MTQKQKEIMKNVYVEIKGSRRRLSNVQAITDDMTNLKRIKTGSVDRIICNNSLQWANDWKATIQEMARVIRPETGGYLYLVIHPHEMALYNHDRTPLIKLGEFGPEDLFNALEDNGFKILTSQPITGQKGMGQMGRGISRIFFYAKHSGKNCR
jgi:SAM-dependent methyltransferase